MKMKLILHKAMLIFILIQIWILQSRYILVKIAEKGKVEREQRMIVSRINSGKNQIYNCRYFKGLHLDLIIVTIIIYQFCI